MLISMSVYCNVLNMSNQRCTDQCFTDHGNFSRSLFAKIDNLFFKEKL